MGFIAEYTLSSPVLRDTFRAIPGLVLDMVDIQLWNRRRARFVFWAREGDRSALDATLAADSTVDGVRQLADVPDRGLFLVRFTPEGTDRLTYPSATDRGIVFLHATVTRDGSHVRAQVPSRDALGDYREACREKGVRFQLDRLYRAQEEVENPYNLTDSQREALLLAYERGYFGAQRETDLSALASELGVTRQAFAGRLQRGFENLLERTVAAEADLKALHSQPVP